MSRFLTAIVVILVTALGVYAQNDDGVTADDVDAVVSNMYCPICENEPLDTCYNPTCIQWKNEIRSLLAQGYTGDEIVTMFVDRYGEHVVGVPQDPVLRFISFSAPVIGTLLAVALGYFTFSRWQQAPQPELATVVEEKPKNLDAYRSRIEQDLQS